MLFRRKKKKHANRVPPSTEVTIIIQYLNRLVGTRFSTTSIRTIELIRKLNHCGYAARHMVSVIKFKYAEWGANERMHKYLRPKTLFDLYNFRKYLDEMSKGSLS